MSPAPVRLGFVCHKWDHKAHVCTETVDVWQVTDTNGAHFVGKLAVDADGAPRAYHPDDKKPHDNTAGAFDWLANVSIEDLHGIQGQDAVGPAQGFYVSATSLHDPSVTNVKDARRYVDASVVPYIVLPKATFPVPTGQVLSPGSVAFVINLETGNSTGAIFADVGRAVGEGSIALAVRLGLNPFSRRYPPKVVGVSGERFFYLVFAGVVVAPPWPVESIQATAETQFNAWGGEAKLKELYPGTPDIRLPTRA